MVQNLEYYKVFCHVARCGSLTLAARELSISQPAVSQSIRLLEASVGAKLFVRSTKGVKLIQGDDGNMWKRAMSRSSWAREN